MALREKVEYRHDHRWHFDASLAPVVNLQMMLLTFADLNIAICVACLRCSLTALKLPSMALAKGQNPLVYYNADFVYFFSAY